MNTKKLNLKYNPKVKRVYLILSLMVSVSLTGFADKTGSGIKDQNNNIPIQQQPKDLLAGVSKALSYSGFRTGQHPDRGTGAINPTNDQILEDLKLISGHSGIGLIRLYDSGANSETVLKVISENKIKIKVMLGIWLNAELSNHKGCAWLTEPIPQETLDKNKLKNAAEIQNGIRLANQYPGIVAAVNVGNEALVDWNDHKVDVDTVISYVRKVKKSIKQPVSVADNYEWWAAHGSKLAKELDFICIHVYPVWEGKDIEEGLSYSIANVQKVRNALPKTKIVISEAGWASMASEFGSRASEEKQATYFNQIMEWSAKMNITTFFFEAFDEDWKGDPNNSLGAEKHWGLYTVDRKPKKVLQ
jgi:exo-beta-1,3-glucanase (GH17 family)